MEPTWKTDDGSIQLYHADCLDVLPTLGKGSVDAVIADLPYGTTDNKWDSVIPLAVLWENLYIVAKESAVFVLNASQPFTSTLIESNRTGFRHEWIWIKDKGSNFANTIREPFKEHESVLVFSRGKWTYNKQMQERAASGTDRAKYGVKWESKSTNYRKFKGRPATRIMAMMRVPSSHQRFGVQRGLHPTQKPLPLADYFTRTYSNPGELVLDVCMGSGTYPLAAAKCGRRVIGIEKNPDYFRIAVERIENELKKTDLKETQVSLFD
jgi:site-specific DNA-methyltransferase (adenine-specific)